MQAHLEMDSVDVREIWPGSRGIIAFPTFQKSGRQQIIARNQGTEISLLARGAVSHAPHRTKYEQHSHYPRPGSRTLVCLMEVRERPGLLRMSLTAVGSQTKYKFSLQKK